VSHENHTGKRACAGFTLLELLVVMALAGILMSIAPSLFSAAVPGMELRVTARELAATLRETRNRAIVRGEPLDVLVTGEPPAYRVVGGPHHGLPATILVSVKQSPERLVHLDPAWPGNRYEQDVRIRFYPDGSSSGASILLERGGLSYVVAADWLLGTVTVTAGDGNEGASL